MKKHLIYASDIDNTLLFSEKMVDKAVHGNELMTINDGENHIMYLSKKAHETLEAIHSMSTFIPVTARSIDQYQRLSVFHNEVRPKFAITSNGGNILIDGKIDTEYHTYLAKHSHGKIEKYQKAIAEFQEKFPKELIERVRYIDDCYHMINLTVNAETDPTLVEKIKNALPSDGTCLASLQGKKIHIIPSYISKLFALQYLAEKYGLTLFVSAGDALTDVDMLQGAKVGIIPATGELLHTHGKEELKKQGFEIAHGSSLVHSGEETIKRAHLLIKESK